MNPPLCKHRAHCHWRYLTTFPLAILLTYASSHHGSAFSILLDWLFYPFSNARIPLVGAFSIVVKPVCIISGGFGAPPEIQRGIKPTCGISYGLFSHTHVHDRGLPVGIFGSSQRGERWTFLVHPGGCIFWSLHLFFWWHESHWCLFPWIFISSFFRI